MANVAAITLALLASASSLACAQGTATGMGGAAAPALAMPGSTAPAGFTIDQKGVKRAGSAAPSPGNMGGPGNATAAERKAGPLPGNGKDANTENRVTAGGFGANAPLPAKGQAADTGKAKVGTSANLATDASGNKSFFESRSNTNPRAASAGPANARSSQAATATGTATSDDAAKKSIFESRSNTARTDGAAAQSTPEAASSAGSVFKN